MTLSNVASLLLWQVMCRPMTAFAPHRSPFRQTRHLYQSMTNTEKMFFASIEQDTVTAEESLTAADATGTSSTHRQQQQRRVLGSQELLMLPRQYGPNPNVKFPQMNHVSVHVLSETPSMEALKESVANVMKAHPLLHARVEGTGEPDKRIDLFQMVREGEPSPLTFVTTEDFEVDDVLSTVRLPTTSREELDSSWKAAFQRYLNDGSWCQPDQGPLWKMELHTGGSGPCAIELAFNHAISDQSSANRLVDQILRQVAELEEKGSFAKAVVQDMPFALEDSVLGEKQRFSDIKAGGFSPATISYVAGKAAEGFRDPVILPDGQDKSNPLGALTIISGRTAGGTDVESETRMSVVEFRTIPRETMRCLLDRCREKGVSVSHALTAAVTLTSTDFIGGESGTKKKRNYKVLQSLDMRRFGKQLDQGNTVACMAGSMDLMHGPLPDGSGQAVRSNASKENLDLFWKVAREGKEQTERFFATGGPEEAVRVFDFAMTISDLNNLVYLTSQSKDTKGRAYGAGATNLGVYERQSAFASEGESGSEMLKSQHGRYRVEHVFYATPHTQSGCLYPISCLTINGELKVTVHPVSPIVSEEMNKKLADAFVDLITTVATGEATSTVAAQSKQGFLSNMPDNILTLVAAALGAVAVASHGQAWIDFYRSVMAMKVNVVNPGDFWAALNFWIFFAVGHPLLPPILWISDVLHGSPGPKIADLVPVTFLAGNALVIAAVALSKDLRNALNLAAVAAFFTYIGAGLEGTAGLGDFNLALDDSYKGQIVKGCPAYDQVRQTSMDNFDIEKYQGLWYEQKFHDWTQFKEVYDTTLAIKLTADGKGWVDDFAVKGPAPDAAPLSWDKSPVANGAHYFLFGRIDDKDPVGVLRESGFGVEFPNYIVDVQRDPTTGEYTEAIQFQCLERGGVRVFEGINFMSRSPTMSNERMAAMHARAEKAGMYPYGASPEQMHTVARRSDPAPLTNSWQSMWHAIGFDKLLELLTESIEDGGR